MGVAEALSAALAARAAERDVIWAPGVKTDAAAAAVAAAVVAATDRRLVVAAAAGVEADADADAGAGWPADGNATAGEPMTEKPALPRPRSGVVKSGRRSTPPKLDASTGTAASSGATTVGSL